MSTMRQSNWPARLNAFIEQRRAMPFTWGKNDCCLFTCDWISLMTGIDPAKSLRKKYGDALGAQRILKRRGGVEAVAACECGKLGWSEVLPALAHRGDPVSVDTEHGAALGVSMGRHAAFPGPEGVAFVLMSKCRRAWRIP